MFTGVLALVYSPTVGASVNPSYDAALSQCQTAGSTTWHNDATFYCTVMVSPNNPSQYAVVGLDASHTTWYANLFLQPFTGAPPPPSCSTLPSFDMIAAIGTAGSKKMCQPGVAGAVAPQGCALKLVQFGNAVQMSSGAWKTHVHVSADGGTCTQGSNGSPDTYGDGGSSLTPVQMPALPVLPVPPTISAQVCQNGTCYNPNTGDVTAVAGSSMLHVPVSTMKSGDGGACYSDGSSALCAGSPNAPQPPSPPITDPATQIKSADHYATVTDTGTGQTIAVVVYTPPSVATTSGKVAGDDSPAKASSSGSASGQYGGGGDCNTPPACSGDAVMCGASRTQWATTCQLHRDLGGDMQPADFQSLKTAHSQADVWGDQASGNTLGDAANAGNYDTSGFGYATSCPLHDLSVPFLGKTLAIPFSKMCVVGAWIRAAVLAFAYFLAAMITWKARAQ